jgi:hypothetical protein
MRFQLGEELHRVVSVSSAEAEILRDGQLHQDRPLLPDQAQAMLDALVERLCCDRISKQDLPSQRG